MIGVCGNRSGCWPVCCDILCRLPLPFHHRGKPSTSTLICLWSLIRHSLLSAGQTIRHFGYNGGTQGRVWAEIHPERLRKAGLSALSSCICKHIACKAFVIHEAQIKKSSERGCVEQSLPRILHELMFLTCAERCLFSKLGSPASTALPI